MIILDTVKSYTDFLDYSKNYTPNPENGYINLSDYKYLVAIEGKGEYFIGLSDSQSDALWDVKNGAIVHLISLQKHE